MGENVQLYFDKNNLLISFLLKLTQISSHKLIFTGFFFVLLLDVEALSTKT